MSKLTIDTEEISKVCNDASGVMLDMEAEKSLYRLLEIKEQIDEFVEKVKAKIVDSAITVDPHFTALKGDLLKMEYRAYGAVYEMPDHSQVLPEFKVEKTSYSINTKAVEAFEEVSGELPTGIARADRKKQLTIKKLA